MTSNAEEQATTQPVTPAQPPKATKRATVPPRKPRVAPSKPKSGKKASAAAQRRTKSQKAAKSAAGAREGSKAAKVLDLLKRSGGVTLKELYQSHGLAAAFGPRLPVRHRRKEDEADCRLRQRCGR
jgi:hypothetical protein